MVRIRRPKPVALDADSRSAETIAWVEDVEVGGVPCLLIDVPGSDDRHALGVLTPSEREVARCVAAGMNNAAVAATRGTSARTVANQLASLYRKMGVGSRAELRAALARRRA